MNFISLYINSPNVNLNSYTRLNIYLKNINLKLKLNKYLSFDIF